MAAPFLNDYVNGQGTLSGDGLNTFFQTCDSLAQLRSFTGVTGIQVYLRGYSAPGDGGQGAFYWSALATGPDNGTTIIVPTGALVGAWLRLSFDAFGASISGLIFCGDGGGSAIPTGVMRLGRCPFACTINDWSLQAEVAGNAVLDIWAAPFVNDAEPTVANTICGGNYPTLAGNSQILSTNLTGWAPVIPANTAFVVNIRSLSTITKLTLTLGVTKT